MATYAVKTPPQHGPWADFLDVWRAVDQCDAFEQAWNFDHFYPLIGDTHGPCLESWTMLAALAQATSRIRIGSMVNGMHYRHPAVTANMAATVDIISGGRLDLGMGAGWNLEESDAYGIDLGTITERLDRFEEGVGVIVRLLSQEVTDFEGRYYSITDARCEPKPVQQQIPLLIGGSGRRRTLKVVAKWAQKWDASFGSVEDWHDKNDALLGHCADIGRDPSEIKRSAHIAWPAGADPQRLADEAAPLVDAGVDQIIFSMRGPYSATEIEPLGAALAG
ncbi:MAG: TIGR03560 family F420-dependent LLM class oxidoreductase [Actinomycetota bacterium]|jgi:F420-dependent oxidoreductase-like protein|nr:TIGR03560 family F420-dependent LLM class oxidoreductase [Actinomycetota bacterium]